MTKSGSTLTYGPYQNVPASANVQFANEQQKRVAVQYGYDHPVLEVKKLRRAAEISHWGANLNIQDEIELHNAGPRCAAPRPRRRRRRPLTRPPAAA